MDRAESWGFAERRIVRQEEIKIGSIATAGLLRFEIAQLVALYDSGATPKPRGKSPGFKHHQNLRQLSSGGAIERVL